MIEMGVRQDDGIDRFCVKCCFGVIKRFERPGALEQAMIYQDARIATGDFIAGSGDGAACAMDGDNRRHHALILLVADLQMGLCR